MKYLIPILPALMIIWNAFSQNIKYKDYDWEAEPKIHSLPEEKQFEIILKDKTAIEYAFDENNNFYEYFLRHKIIRVNSDDAIEQNNKIYLPLKEVSNIIKQKARVITPNGKVRELNENDIKEAVDEEDKQSYKYFAVEGVEKGSEIEYFYLLKIEALYTGSNRVFQSDVLTKNVDFEIISPTNLIFLVKSYNGFPEMENDTTQKEKNRWFVHVDSISAIKEDELFSNYTPNLMQINFKLDKNISKDRSTLFSFGSASETIYQNIYTPLSKGTQKQISKLIKTIGIENSMQPEEKIRKIENYIKTNYQIIEASVNGMSDVEFILTNKVCNKRGIVKLFAAVFNSLEIEHHIVLTSNRYELKFDPDFEGYNFLDEYLIYFPQIDKHIAPAATFYRLGIIPYQWTNNYGLYIKPVTLGDFKSGIGKIKFIQPENYDKNYMDLDITIPFDENFTEIPLKVKKTFGGYYAQNSQPYYGYMDETQKKETNESLAEVLGKVTEFKKLEVENAGCEWFEVKPLIVHAEFNSNEFIEKAGTKYLFKVGDLIGEQAEMYKDENRKLEVENRFNHRYHREIHFNIPAGYKINNLDAIKMDVYLEHEGEKTAAFISKYEVNGDKVNVVIDEYYKKIIYPLEQFENYRKVINAAADFNKVVLFIEEK